MATTQIDDSLWERFHRAVNMTSRELREWLATASSGERMSIGHDPLEPSP